MSLQLFRPGLVAAMAVVVLFFSACPNPVDPKEENQPDGGASISPAGAWRYGDGSDYWILSADGTMETSEYFGAWSVQPRIAGANTGKLQLLYRFRSVDGVRIQRTGTKEWHYLVAANRLYASQNPFLRIGSGSGLAGTFERVETHESLGWIKVRIVLSLDASTIEYLVFDNLGSDYDPSTGTGTWATAPVMELRGTIQTFPAALPGSVTVLLITDIVPQSEEFPEGNYSFVLFDENSLEVNPGWLESVGYDKPTIYAGGCCESSSGIAVPGYWRNGTWIALPTEAGRGGMVNGICESEGSVYAAGWREDSEGVRVAGYWKDGVWKGLPKLAVDKASEAHAVQKSPGAGLTIGGFCFDSADGSVPAVWVADQFFFDLPVESGTSGSVLSVLLDTSNGNVYAVGRKEDLQGKSLAGYWFYDKTNNFDGPFEWIDLAPPAGLENITLTAVDLNEEVPCFAGFGVNGSGISRGVYWEGATPKEESTKYGTEAAACHDISVVLGHVYTAGWVDSGAKGVLAMVRKDGHDGPPTENEFSTSLPALAMPNESKALAMEILSSYPDLGAGGRDLYVGGFSKNAEGKAVPGYWKNDVWVALPRISSQKSGYVNTIYVDN